MRVYVVVEGQTEEAIVKGLIARHLRSLGVYLHPIIVRTSPRHRGGGGHWSKWENDIRRLLSQHRGPDVRVTTMFDLFRLPKGFPGWKEHSPDPDTNRRCDRLQGAMRAVFGDPRLIPYLQRHEVEALVLAALDGLAMPFDAPEDLRGLASLRAEIGEQAPEDVDDGPETAPSKRLTRHIPSYRKTLHGPLAVEAAGLPTVRARCPRFDQWISQLEGLSHKRKA